MKGRRTPAGIGSCEAVAMSADHLDEVQEADRTRVGAA